MSDMVTTMLLAGVLAAAGVWAAGRVAAAMRDVARMVDEATDVEACCCGRYDLSELHAQHAGGWVHARDLCQPKREWIAR